MKVVVEPGPLGDQGSEAHSSLGIFFTSSSSLFFQSGSIRKNSRRLSCFDLTLSSVLRAREPQRRYLLSYMVISAVLWAAAVIS